MNVRSRSTLHPLPVFFIMALLAILAMGPGSFAGTKGLQIGDQLPDFQLQDYNGKSYSFSDYSGKVVVLNFCSQECPWSRGADPKINEVAKTYADKGVVFLGIDSHRSTTTDEIKAHAEKANVPYPILKDVGNVYADEVGAMRTPEIFVADSQGKLAYHGAFDNRTSPEQVGETNYVTDALNALLANEPIAKTQAAAWGCGIKRVAKSDMGEKTSASRSGEAQKAAKGGEGEEETAVKKSGCSSKPCSGKKVSAGGAAVSEAASCPAGKTCGSSDKVALGGNGDQEASAVKSGCSSKPCSSQKVSAGGAAVSEAASCPAGKSCGSSDKVALGGNGDKEASAVKSGGSSKPCCGKKVSLGGAAVSEAVSSPASIACSSPEKVALGGNGDGAVKAAGGCPYATKSCGDESVSSVASSN